MTPEGVVKMGGIEPVETFRELGNWRPMAGSRISGCARVAARSVPLRLVKMGGIEPVETFRELGNRRPTAGFGHFRLRSCSRAFCDAQLGQDGRNRTSVPGSQSRCSAIELHPGVEPEPRIELGPSGYKSDALP